MVDTNSPSVLNNPISTTTGSTLLEDTLDELLELSLDDELIELTLLDELTSLELTEIELLVELEMLVLDEGRVGKQADKKSAPPRSSSADRLIFRTIDYVLLLCFENNMDT